MGRILLGTGKYAATPYYFENLGLKVYSAEELSYVLKENAFLLDREIINKRLVRWIEEELALSELADALYPLLHKKTPAGAFAGVILRYTGFYDEEIVERAEEIYATGANLNVYEKLKSRVDYLVQNGRYTAAILEYEVLLRKLPEEEKELTSKIIHNMGVALCGLFLFEEAAKQFLKSYELWRDRETLVEYLAALRLSMKEEDYIAFAAGHPEYYEETLTLEKRVEELLKAWEESEQKRSLDRRLLRKVQGDSAGYYAETDKRLYELKNEYRENVGS
ncbi:MAG: hypothetical protein K2I01_07075 [Lachnospiraceae bacterium]|nr:hypothetical protein [Lachnospiraceae bacterium]